MPAFRFEKIPPPVHRVPLPLLEKKQRGVIVQLLGRFAEARARRSGKEKAVIGNQEPGKRV